MTRALLAPLQLAGAFLVWGLFLAYIAIVLGLLVVYGMVTGIRV